MTSIDVDRTRTKIVCTIGPASRNESTLGAMIHAGMNVARINLSHGTHDEYRQDIACIRRLAKEEGANVAVMADLQGPKFRVGEIGPGSLQLKADDTVVLTSSPTSGKSNAVHLPHPEFIGQMNTGDRLLLDDGTLEFVVEKATGKELTCRVVVGGELRSHKGVTAPGKTIDLPAITAKDREDALFALKQEVDFLALSYIRSVDTVHEWRSLIQRLGGARCEIGIVGKIETREAIDDFDNILECVDAVIVARGDLGVAVSVEEIPLHQKAIIHSCNQAGVPVITATQLLESMIDSPRPTRAETSDVANTILDGTDALLLSGETAAGRYPVRAVEMIAKIAAIMEGQLPSGRQGSSFSDVKHRQPITDAISNATSAIARDLDARLIVVSTWSGYTARQVARERPRQPIVALTPNHATFRRLALTWGVIPALVPEQRTTDQTLSTLEATVLELGLAECGELIVVTGGLPLGGDGRTNFIKVHRL